MHKSFVRFIALVATALSLVSAPALAQVITTSSLNGTVLNDQGQPVANATISVTHGPTGSTYSATTRADGTYVIRGLRPGGPYTVTARSEGSAASETREVYLELDRGADITSRLRSDVVQLEAFAVTASATDTLFDPNQMGSSTYFNERDIRNLPAGDRSINSLARLDPKVSYNRDPNDRAISVAGLSNRYNSIQVDGVSASDPFGLNANNTAAERNVIPLDSLEALTVTTSADVRRSGFIGAQVNAITKSGSNDLHGSLYYTFRNQNMVGEDIDGVTYALPDFEEKTWGATLRGPILKNKLFFSLAYEKVDEDRIPPSPTTMVDQATVTQIVNAAKSLGFEPGSATPPAGNKLKDENIMAKVDWEINANHRATIRYQDVESSRPTFPGFGTGVGQNNFSFDSHWYDQKIKNTSYIGQLVSRWNDRLNTELSFSRSKYDSMPVNNSTQPRVQIRNVPVAGSSNTSFVNFGTEISRHANILKVDTDTAELFASYELNDKHTLQAGIQYDLVDVYNLFVQNALGSYDFNSLTEFLNVAANNNGTVNYREYIYNQIIPGVEPAALFKESNLGLFIKDSWRVNSRLSIDVGARIDVAGLPDAIPYNQTFHNTFGVRNDHSYDGEKILQPRAGFNWQPDFGGTRTTIRGSFGLYYGRAPRVWISNSYSNT
ncbi:MAG TPA: TonB-dependent receptor, partial [Acidobacteriota bacterium]|nr:TonB-dependent receptor [Acidobacteriota bacterium]